MQVRVLRPTLGAALAVAAPAADAFDLTGLWIGNSGLSIYISSEVGTCKYKYKRVDTIDPGIASCLVM
jgi:hypothetical protein